MKISTREYLVPEGARVRLEKWPTQVPPVYRTKDEYEKLLARHVSRLSALQELLYASNQYALLVIFQGMDTSGKDGAIKHVMSGVNPQGCQVTSFKHPSATELQHDFLWRTTRALPERGRIGIFNRSYYEEVVVVRVHPELLRGGRTARCLGQGRQGLEGAVSFDPGPGESPGRSGMQIVKFFLHVSKEEQRKRLLERIDDPEKSWKFSAADIDERNLWPDYMTATRIAWAQPARRTRPGTSSPRTTSRTRGSSSRRSSRTHWQSST